MDEMSPHEKSAILQALQRPSYMQMKSKGIMNMIQKCKSPSLVAVNEDQSRPNKFALKSKYIPP